MKTKFIAEAEAKQKRIIKTLKKSNAKKLRLQAKKRETQNKKPIK